MRVLHLKEINSTNDYVKKHMDELDNLTFVYADKQTSGRGRLERKWVDSGDDNLFLTIVIKPDSSDISKLPSLTQYLSVILSMLLEEYGLEPQIKWPNDVLINGKKIAGILAEGTTLGGNFLGMALGIGVNLNTPPEKLSMIDKPATSLYNELGEYIDKLGFLNKLLEKFCLLYDRYNVDEFPFIKEYYEKRAMFMGTEVKINVLGEMHYGLAEGITDDGSLLLKEKDKITTYFIGDIL